MKVHRPSGAAMRPSSRGVMFVAGAWLELLLCLGLFVARPAAADPEELSGWWRIVDRVESSDYAAYRGSDVRCWVQVRVLEATLRNGRLRVVSGTRNLAQNSPL